MSDLIERQELIDEINRLVKETPNIKIGTSTFRDGILDAYARVLGIIRSVPSAHSNTSNTLGALDCVERQDAIDAVKFGITYAKAFNKSTGEVKELFKEGNKALNEAAERLKELPSVQPERKEGKWIKDRDGIYHCSCCGTDYLMYELAVKDTHYCPNCGCRMEEGDPDDNE